MSDRNKGHEAYNIVSDTVVGVNVRKKDNLYQALAIAACTLVGAGAGLLLAESALGGALLGGLAGMVVGLFASGIFLMIYRGVRHLQGKHD